MQASQKVAYKIDAYLIKNNITNTKLCIAQILLSKDIAIQTTNKKKTKKLKEEDGWTKMLKSKVKLVQKWYEIVALRILIAKIELKKAIMIKKNLLCKMLAYVLI